MQHGFTLVELAIVLVILGLLVGGVLAGQNLIRAAELRAVSTEFVQYQTAVLTFREKYFALPGDMDNAEAFWGTDVSGCPNGGGATGVCNGNGDGEMGPLRADCEQQEFFRHLTNAGLIEGNTVPNTASNCYSKLTVGSDHPLSRLNGASWMVHYLGSITEGSSWPGNAFFTADYGNMMTLAAGQGTNHMHFEGYLMTPAEAWSIDKKSDDGMPASGRIMTPRALTNGTLSNPCNTTTSSSSAEYDLSNDDKACSLLFPRVVQ